MEPKDFATLGEVRQLKKLSITQHFVLLSC